MLGLAAALLDKKFENPTTEIDAAVLTEALFPRKNLYTAVVVGRNHPRHLMDRAGPENAVRPITEMVLLPEMLAVRETPLHPSEARYAELWQETDTGLENEDE
jgi:hypothetical protein